MLFIDMWHLDSFGSGESKSILLDQSYVDIFKQKHEEEYVNLSSIADKLKFYDNNRHLFEFPFNQFEVKNYSETRFAFDFKPAPHFLDTHIYNPWFIERSKEHLTHVSSLTCGLPFHSCEQLWEDFMQIKDCLPFLRGFIEREKEKFKSLCEEHAPGRFKYWYNLKITNARILAPRHELTKHHWKELIVVEMVNYIIKLEKYEQEETPKLSVIGLQPVETQNPQATSSKKQSPNANTAENKDLTFLQLFRNNHHNMTNFISILAKHGYLSDIGHWDNDFSKPGILVTIIDFIEIEGIILSINNRAQVGRIFNLQFNLNMTTRNYGKPKKTLMLDPHLKIDLKRLKK